MKKNYLLLLFGLITFSINAQESLFKDSIIVESKKWYRDQNREIKYTDWQNFSSHTINMLRNFNANVSQKLSLNGGDANQKKLKATGFFRVEKIGERWFLIDPKGYHFISTGITSTRTGNSPNNKAAFAEKFGNKKSWIKSTAEICQANGFNTAGSWSDIEAIQEHNNATKTPLAYTTQLNLLSAYSANVAKVNPARKGVSKLLLVFDDGFKNWCEKEASKLTGVKNDPNLLGHFSDNELPFTRGEAKGLITSDNSDQTFQFVRSWAESKQYQLNNLSDEKVDELIGFIAERYFSVVYKALKKYDPHHLYIGSRLHAAAKNNPHIFYAAAPFIDIVSINYYGFWEPQDNSLVEWKLWGDKPFMITEFYTKAEDSGMPNISGAGWLVRTERDRGIHYQNFTMKLLADKNCVGWHWFRYQDNDPDDPTADPSNNDSNKGIVTTKYETYQMLLGLMKQVNVQKYQLIKFFDKNGK